MVTIKEASAWALALPLVEEVPHFHKTSFRVKGKIFATLDVEKKLLMVKLNPEDQSVFCSYDKETIYPVPGSWGKTGCTYLELSKVRQSIAKDALNVAHETLIGKLTLK